MYKAVVDAPIVTIGMQQISPQYIEAHHIADLVKRPDDYVVRNIKSHIYLLTFLFDFLQYSTEKKMIQSEIS